MLYSKILATSVMSVILINLVGCSGVEPQAITKIEYVQRECPKPLNPPEFMSYEPVILEINSEVYYAVPKSEGIKMSTNWISYKEWSEGNYRLMLKSSESSETPK